MQPDPEPISNQPPEPEALNQPKSQQEEEQDAGDFITRHVLEKDSVFFEG